MRDCALRRISFRIDPMPRDLNAWQRALLKVIRAHRLSCASRRLRVRRKWDRAASRWAKVAVRLYEQGA